MGVSAIQRNGPENIRLIITGISEKEAALRLKKYGPKAVSAFMGELVDAVAIIAIVIINAALGFIQELRTEKTLDALKSLAASSAKVIRDGMLHNVAAENIVPGDLI